jgi:hypothetical protein
MRGFGVQSLSVPQIGRSHEELGDLPAASASYQLEAVEQVSVYHDRYGDLLRDAITRALHRTKGV